jgi:flagellar protein FlaG
MTSTAPISGLTPEPASAQSAPTTAPASPGKSQTPAPQTGDDADLRLVIEDDKAAGSYVYVTINSVTGEVVSQVPREQLLKMREDPGYQPGAVVDSRS